MYRDAHISLQARDNKLSIEDMAGGSFTISNGGVFGSMMGTPIINLPQTGVLGLHAIKDRPVAINGHVEIRPVGFLPWSQPIVSPTNADFLSTDDVPRSDIRPPAAGWQGSCAIPGQGQGIYRRSKTHATGVSGGFNLLLVS